MAKGLPEYSDEELLQMLQEFQALSEEEKAARRIGAGVDKIAYDIPGKNLVLKLPNIERPYNKYGLDTDYLYSKLLSKSIPVETPVLIKQPQGFGQTDALIQRKLIPISDQTAPDSAFYDSLYKNFPNDKEAREAALKVERQRIKELPGEKEINSYFKEFDKKGLNDADLHRANIALDAAGKAKAIDVAPFYYDRIENADKLNSGLARARDTFYNKMDALTKPRIYRSIPIIGTAIGAGLAAISGEANAASLLPILGETDSLGPERGSEDYEIENPQANPAARRAALESLLKK